LNLQEEVSANKKQLINFYPKKEEVFSVSETKKKSLNSREERKKYLERFTVNLHTFF
jgi:hypothetical protein